MSGSSTNVDASRAQESQEGVGAAVPSPLAPTPFDADAEADHSTTEEPTDRADDDEASTMVPMRTVVLLVSGMCLVYFFETGIESGTNPCVLTTLQGDLDVSTTAVTAAFAATDVAKVLFCPLVGYLGASEHKPVFIVFSTLVWSAGCLLIGFGNHIAYVAASSFLMGMGYSFITTLIAPVVDDLFSHAVDKHRAAHHNGVIVSMTALGVAVAFVVCGATLDFWRWNYYITPPLLIFFGGGFLLAGHNANLPLLIAHRAALAEEDKTEDAELVAGPEGGGRVEAGVDEPGVHAATVPVGPEATTTSPSDGAADEGDSNDLPQREASIPSPTQSPRMRRSHSTSSIGHPEQLTGDQLAAVRRKSVRVEEREGVHNVSTFMAALKGDDVERPPFFQLLKLVLSNGIIFFTILSQTANMFYVAAFVVLMPKFFEEHLEQSKSDASFVMGAIIPAVFIGIIVGGWWCKRKRYNLRQMLKFVMITNCLSLPLTVGAWWIPSFTGLVIVAVFVMFVQFLPSAPSLTSLTPASRLYHHNVKGKTPDGKPLPLSSLVSIANGLSASTIRVGGSIPGPIVLAVLIDQYRDELSMPGAYSLIAGFGSTIGIISAVVAYRLVPDDTVLAEVDASPTLPHGSVPSPRDDEEGTASA